MRGGRANNLRFGGARATERLAALEGGRTLSAAEEAGVAASLLLQGVDIVRGGAVMGDWTRENGGRRRRAEHTQAFSPLFLSETVGHGGATNGLGGQG